MTVVMPLAAWDTINVLCFNRKVLMVGVAGPDDVITLAQTARILAVSADSGSGDFEVEAERIKAIREAAGAAHLDAHILIHTYTGPEVTAGYAAKSFDVAVLNPEAAAFGTIEVILPELAAVADRIVVIQPAGEDLWERVTAALAEAGMLCTSDGSIIVAAPRPSEPIVRRG